MGINSEVFHEFKEEMSKTSEVLTYLNGLGEIEARAVLLATGVRERPRAARMIPCTRPRDLYNGVTATICLSEHLPVKRAVIIMAWSW